MEYTFAQYQESANYLRSRIGSFVPKVAMVLGSGLGFLGDVVENAVAVDYKDIPWFKSSTAPGHKGRLVFVFQLSICRWRGFYDGSYYSS